MFLSDSANEAESSKANNANVHQFSEGEKLNSDNILVEIYTNFKKHANEMKGNMYGKNIFYMWKKCFSGYITVHITAYFLIHLQQFVKCVDFVFY